MRSGQAILRGVAVVTAVGGFVMDLNRTHMFNPQWTPHAKFHDAQTIVLGALLGGSSLGLLVRQAPSPQVRAPALAAVLSAFFWIALELSFLFPGARGLEAEVPSLVPRIRGVWINERFASVLMLLCIAVGYLLERGAARDSSARS
ncbi:DUF6640 family protein [Arthrobacter sedimenti]|uniref:DUF6640 family protein n=1 Tax=Arthrobacter sedimenti TaxID=2694931 RepID=UPI000B355338|nr:DUF6640 family protein [Arthrobacter sedimenti]OUM41836.1 hypothetical protein B8W73_09405 [Arthrobacter agilis]